MDVINIIPPKVHPPINKPSYNPKPIFKAPNYSSTYSSVQVEALYITYIGTYLGNSNGNSISGDISKLI